MAEELEALALEKELAAERKNKGKDNEDQDDDDDSDHKEANGVKQDTDDLVEITQLLESTELSSTRTEKLEGQTITETTKVTETTVVETQGTGSRFDFAVVMISWCKKIVLVCFKFLICRSPLSTMHRRS